MRLRIRFTLRLTFHRPVDVYIWNFRFLRDTVRNDNEVFATKEIQDSVIDAMIRWAQLIDAISQKVGNRTPELMPPRSQ